MSEGDDQRQDRGDNNGNDESNGTSSAAGGSTSVWLKVKTKLLEDKVESAMWMGRIFTIVCSIFTLLPLIGDQQSMFSKALISCAATNALRLRQRVPHFSFAREYFSQLFMEDSCHYLLFALLFATSVAPVTMALVPVALFALIQSVKFTTAVLDLIGPDSVKLVRAITTRLTQNSVNIFRFIAINEILLMPSLILMIFSGQASVLAPFLYYRFLCQRYLSRRNPYCKSVFGELKMGTDQLMQHRRCPQFARSIISKSVSFISRLAPAT